MKFPPFVIAFHENDFYFFYPEWINKEVTDPELKMYVKAIMYDSVRQFSPAKNYNDLINEIIKFVTT